MLPPDRYRPSSHTFLFPHFSRRRTCRYSVIDSNHSLDWMLGPFPPINRINKLFFHVSIDFIEVTRTCNKKCIFFLFLAHYTEWITTTRIATFDHYFSIFLCSEYFLHKVVSSLSNLTSNLYGTMWTLLDWTDTVLYLYERN